MTIASPTMRRNIHSILVSFYFPSCGPIKHAWSVTLKRPTSNLGVRQQSHAASFKENSPLMLLIAAGLPSQPKIHAMSLPFYNIKCTKCDHKSGYNFGTIFAYSGNSDEEPFMQISWCESCDRITHTCEKFTSACAQERINESKAWIKRNSGIFSHFSKSQKQEAHSATDELATITRRISYFEGLPYKARCIECGGEEISSINLPYDNEGNYLSLGPPHACGGELLVSMEGRFIFSSIRKVIYNENGVITSDGRNKK